LGATGLESDAWVTSDGLVVLDHDGVVGRVRKRALATFERTS
jgi:glycerophosphoryl diester phosphodiesterase